MDDELGPLVLVDAVLRTTSTPNADSLLQGVASQAAPLSPRVRCHRQLVGARRHRHRQLPRHLQCQGTPPSTYSKSLLGGRRPFQPFSALTSLHFYHFLGFSLNNFQTGCRNPAWGSQVAMLAARWPDRHWPPVTPAPASAQLPKPPPSKQQASPIRNYTATLTSTRPNNIEPSRITFEEKNSGDKCDQCPLLSSRKHFEEIQ